MPRARPGPRLDLIAQLAALVGLVVVFLLLLSILREEPATRDAPVAATTSRTTAPPAPLVSEGPILQPPPPLPPSEEELARRAKVVGEGKGGGRPLATSDGAPEKTVRPHIALTDAQGRNVVGALVNAKAKGRKLRPRRTTKEGDVILDAVRVSEVPLTFTVRDARWGKQHFVAPIHEHQQTFKLDTPRRGTLMGSVRASDGTAPRGVVLSLIGRDGTITELEGDDVRFEHDGTFTTPVVPDGYQVRASAPGFCPSDWARTQVSLSVPGTVELVVLRASKISGPLVVTDGTNTERAIEVEL
ncbi:MAG: carboxypeptidase-like regulatory domain-containing protein, partial [Planctomycetota bacterium]